MTIHTNISKISEGVYIKIMFHEHIYIYIYILIYLCIHATFLNVNDYIFENRRTVSLIVFHRCIFGVVYLILMYIATHLYLSRLMFVTNIGNGSCLD